MLDVAARIDDEISQDAQRVSRYIFGLLICLFLFILLIRPGDHFLGDSDTYWHIAVGQKIWQARSVPLFDDLSHTFQGQPWIAKEWLSQLILFAAYTLGGWWSVVVVTACAIATTYALLFLVLAQKMRLTVAIGISVAACAFGVGHFLARPHIFANPLIILWVAGLVHAVETKAAPSMLLLPVMTLWANIHASFTLGLALGLFLAVEAVYNSDPGSRARTAARWGVFLAVAVGSACLTPYGYRPMLVTLQLFGGTGIQYIQEWQPVSVGFGFNEVLILACLFLTIYYGVKVGVFRLLLTLGLVYLMFMHVRFALLFAIIAPILLMTSLTNQFPFLRLSTQLETDPEFFELALRYLRIILFPLCSFASISVLIFLFGMYGRSVTPNANITPAGAVNYLYDQNLKGKMYNDYTFGGYLIFRGIKTFIDGRTELFSSNGFMINLFENIGKHPKEFIPLLDDYDVSLALIRPDSIESQELDRSSKWNKVYSDEVSTLYKRGQ